MRSNTRSSKPLVADDVALRLSVPRHVFRSAQCSANLLQVDSNLSACSIPLSPTVTPEPVSPEEDVILLDLLSGMSRLSIGTAESSDLRLDETVWRPNGVSEHFITFTLQPGAIWRVETRSTHGFILNGRPLHATGDGRPQYWALDPLSRNVISTPRFEIFVQTKWPDILLELEYWVPDVHREPKEKGMEPTRTWMISSQHRLQEYQGGLIPLARRKRNARAESFIAIYARTPELCAVWKSEKRSSNMEPIKRCSFTKEMLSHLQILEILDRPLRVLFKIGPRSRPTDCCRLSPKQALQVLMELLTRLHKDNLHLDEGLLSRTWIRPTEESFEISTHVPITAIPTRSGPQARTKDIDVARFAKHTRQLIPKHSPISDAIVKDLSEGMKCMPLLENASAYLGKPSNVNIQCSANIAVRAALQGTSLSHAIFRAYGPSISDKNMKRLYEKLRTSTRFYNFEYFAKFPGPSRTMPSKLKDLFPVSSSVCGLEITCFPLTSTLTSLCNYSHCYRAGCCPQGPPPEAPYIITGYPAVMGCYVSLQDLQSCLPGFRVNQNLSVFCVPEPKAELLVQFCPQMHTYVYTNIPLMEILVVRKSDNMISWDAHRLLSQRESWDTKSACVAMCKHYGLPTVAKYIEDHDERVNALTAEMRASQQTENIEVDLQYRRKRRRVEGYTNVEAAIPTSDTIPNTPTLEAHEVGGTADYDWLVGLDDLSRDDDLAFESDHNQIFGVASFPAPYPTHTETPPILRQDQIAALEEFHADR